jgi:hypothetical protein
MNQNGEKASRTVPLSALQGEMDAAADFGMFPPTQVEVLAEKPATLLVSPKEDGNIADLKDAVQFIARRLSPGSDSRSFLYRGVQLARLSQITSRGCDVIPSTAPIHASPYAGKAMEYGEVVMAFDSAKLDKTFRKVPKSENPEILNRLKQEFPTVIEMDDDSIWFTKLPPNDERAGTIYVSYYTFFIPGDAREALRFLFLIGRDRDALRTEFQRLTGRT